MNGDDFDQSGLIVNRSFYIFFMKDFTSFEYLDQFLPMSRNDFKAQQINFLKNNGFALPSLNKSFQDLLDLANDDYFALLNSLDVNPSSASFNWSRLTNKHYLKYY